MALLKFFNFYQETQIHLGAVENGRAIDVTASNGSGPKTRQELICGGDAAQKEIQTLLAAINTPAAPDDLVFAPPVTRPEKILCIGLNYADHSAETHMELPDSPTVFSKFANALAAHEQAIPLPKTASQYDYEAELVIVIGKKAHTLKKENALSAIFGYTIGNDLSARDLQQRTSQWLLGKTPDKFAPLGPYIVPAGEIDPANLHIQSYVNGKIRQNGHTSQMIFDCAYIVSYLSQYMTLQPGDIIFTGTPSGVILGYPPEKQLWLKAGDEVRVKIEKIGELTNRLM